MWNFEEAACDVPRDLVEFAMGLESPAPTAMAYGQHGNNAASTVVCDTRSPELGYSSAVNLLGLTSPNDSGIGMTSPSLLPAQATTKTCCSPTSDERVTSPTTTSIGKENSPASCDRPQESLLELIANAILSSDGKQAMLHDIYDKMMEKYPYYRYAKKSWRNSVRHHLSVYQCFEKGPKGRGGKGYFWRIHHACVEDFQRGNYSSRLATQKVQQAKRNEIDQHVAMQRMGMTTPATRHVQTTPKLNTTAPKNVTVSPDGSIHSTEQYGLNSFAIADYSLYQMYSVPHTHYPQYASQYNPVSNSISYAQPRNRYSPY